VGVVGITNALRMLSAVLCPVWVMETQQNFIYGQALS